MSLKCRNYNRSRRQHSCWSQTLCENSTPKFRRQVLEVSPIADNSLSYNDRRLAGHKPGAEVLGGGAEGLVAVLPVRLLAVAAAVAPLLAPPAHEQRLAAFCLAVATVPAHLGVRGG
jgi:hypothetical protein